MFCDFSLRCMQDLFWVVFPAKKEQQQNNTQNVRGGEPWPTRLSIKISPKICHPSVRY